MPPAIAIKNGLFTALLLRGRFKAGIKAGTRVFESLILFYHQLTMHVKYASAVPLEVHSCDASFHAANSVECEC